MTELETVQRAKMYMDKLAQGIDPISDQELPEDAVIVISETEYTGAGKHVQPQLSFARENGIDIRKPLFAVLARNNWPMLGLEAADANLEDVFLALTEKTADTRGKKKRGKAEL